MKISRTLILKPLNSNILVRHRTYDSISYRSLTHWSDGFYRGPRMMPIGEVLMRCSKTGLVFLVTEADEVGSQVDPFNRLAGEPDSIWDHVPFVESASVDDYHFAIHNLFDDPTDIDQKNMIEILRTHAWWRANHPIREDSSNKFCLKTRKNLFAILDSTEERQTGYFRLLRAEIYKQLGDMEAAAKEVMGKPFPPIYQRQVKFMKECIGKGIDKVIRTPFNPFPSDL